MQQYPGSCLMEAFGFNEKRKEKTSKIQQIGSCPGILFPNFFPATFLKYQYLLNLVFGRQIIYLYLPQKVGIFLFLKTLKHKLGNHLAEVG